VKPISRLLLIEDDHTEALAIEAACCPDPSKVAIEVVTNGAAAEDALRDGEYDLIVCDLALPADARRFEPSTDEGMRLFALIREQSQGTPVIVLSGHADIDMMPTFLQANRDGDLYGRGTEEQLVQFFPKERLPDCVDAVRSHIARLEGLDRLELQVTHGSELSLSDQRALKIYGRRTGASRGVAEPFDSGLSDAKTHKVSFTDVDGGSTGTVVAKLGDLRRVVREAAKYEQLAAMLPVGLGAHQLYVVQVGAGRRGALIYQLADEYTRSLFGLIAAGDPAAVAATLRLRQRLGEWATDARVVVRSLAELRRPLISDLHLRAVEFEIPDERGIELEMRETMTHGDLHGLNVLVNQRDEPTLIDYGEVRRANAALDPVTLELSIVYHPAMEGKLGGWPDAEKAAAWRDLDAYCTGCPAAEFVRTCRAWAYEVSAGESEVLATAYAYSLRQLKYAGPTAPVAEAVARGAHAALRGI
jgi:DNA-binding NarL/FixJ family response regulator